MIVLAPLSSSVTKKVKHAAWKKFLTQLNGVGANMDSAQTLRCFMDKHSQASSTLKNETNQGRLVQGDRRNLF